MIAPDAAPPRPAPAVAPPAGSSDPEVGALVLACAAGDRAAFRTLYARVSRLVFGTALAVLRSRELAEDATQDIFLALWRRAGDYDPARGSALAWIAVVARNRALDRLRAERARGFVETRETLPDLPEEGLPAVSVPESIAIRRTLAGLRPEHRRALLLAYVNGYTCTEIADILGVPLGTAKSWLRRGLGALKEALA